MILILGKSGQLAQELALKRLPDIVFAGRDLIDQSEPATVEAAIVKLAPRAVINAAAYTMVDRAESEADVAYAVNAESAAAAAKACAALQVPFIHVSTDYVFGGNGKVPYKEDDPIAPLNVYGASKAKGEALIASSGGTYAIIRTSWVYSRFGSNFVKTMWRLANERDRLSVVADQFGRPTYAADLADACLFMMDVLERNKCAKGVYHYANAGVISWADLAQEVFRLNQLATGKPTQLIRIDSAAFPTLAMRPAWSALDTTKLEALGLHIPDWKTQLALCFPTLSE